MKKIAIIIISIFCFNSIFSQELKVNVIDKTSEIKDEIFHIRANKGDIIRINIKTDIKNEKKATYYELKNIKLYRQFANEEFQYIIDKYDVSNIENLEIVVPSKGIYTLVIDRGGAAKFNTSLKIDRIAESDSLLEIKTQAINVFIYDTVHTYTKDSVVYDYIRASIPKIEQDTLTYAEEHIFIDKAYALRMDNVYVVPISIPMEIYTYYKQQTSKKWGFFISVSDEVYKALQGKVAEVATAGIQAGAGKMMSGKTDEITGVVTKNGLQKTYTVFDKAATANEYAELGGDVSEVAGFEEGSKSSEVAASMTGFTGLTETAMSKATNFIPKIEDEIIYKVLSEIEYTNYQNGFPYTCLQEGHGCYVTGLFDINDPSLDYYIIIENERKTDGDVLDILETVGKSILSQYVYLSLKVFVQKETVQVYDKGYYEKEFIELYNPVWNHKQEVFYSERVIYEDELKPYYKVVGNENIY